MFSGLAFFLLLPLMKRTETISLDTDWLWRVLLFQAGVRAYRFASAAGSYISTAAASSVSGLANAASRFLGTAEEGATPGVFARAWPIGVTALWIAVLLTGYVVIYYF